MSDFPGDIANGKINLDDREALSDLIHALDGKRIVLSLVEYVEQDDLTRLRRYFHGVVLPKIATAAGYSHDPKELAHVKMGLKERFLTVPAAPGEPIQVRSTESLTKAEYSQFIFLCRQYAAETLHIDIEDPR